MRGELAQCHDHARLNDGDLLAQELFAGLDLVGLRVAILRRTAFDDVADVDLGAFVAHGLDHLGQ
jgi:hypothetical protein